MVCRRMREAWAVAAMLDWWTWSRRIWSATLCLQRPLAVIVGNCVEQIHRGCVSPGEGLARCSHGRIHNGLFFARCDADVGRGGTQQVGHAFTLPALINLSPICSRHLQDASVCRAHHVIWIPTTQVAHGETSKLSYLFDHRDSAASQPLQRLPHAYGRAVGYM
jgi:hypothetical protein